jgi:hypothetical protein
MARRQFNVAGRFNVGRLRINRNDPKRAMGIQNARQSMRDIVKAFDQLTNQLHDLSIEACFQNGLRVKERGDYYVPKDTLALLHSGYVEAVSAPSHPGRINIEVGYGKGDDPDYAVIVHEDLSKSHASPTQAKYLQRAIVDEVGSMLARAGVIIGEPFQG